MLETTGFFLKPRMTLFSIGIGVTAKSGTDLNPCQALFYILIVIKLIPPCAGPVGILCIWRTGIIQNGIPVLWMLMWSRQNLELCRMTLIGINTGENYNFKQTIPNQMHIAVNVRYEVSKKR